MGQGKIDVKPLKDGGDIEVKIIQQDGVESGVVYCKYALKTLTPVPILVVKNIKCDFYKDTEFILKTVIIIQFRSHFLLSPPTVCQQQQKPRIRVTLGSWLGTKH